MTARRPAATARRARAGAALALLAALALPAAAANPAPEAARTALPPPTAASPVDADRLHQLTAELRCLVCQNESLADSTAPLALDLKREIVERMAAGERDDQILAFLVERYGDFVTYRPPFTARTWLLWLGPLVLLGAGALVALGGLQRRGQQGTPAAPGDDEPHDPASAPSTTRLP